MYQFQLLLAVGFTLTLITASPLHLGEEYIAKYQQDIEALKKLASEHQFVEKDFDPSLYNETDSLRDAEEYDFIVVGAGAAGAVVASRLSEVPEWKVLLLEAGKPETPVTQIPTMRGLLETSPYNWGFTTSPQKTWCLGMEEHKCAVASGKAIGGTTAINGMLFTRGNHLDYDIWADNGNKDWCYDDVLPYFKKLEDAHIEGLDRKYHNHGGPQHLENPQYLPHYTENILGAAKELGYKIIDYNGKEQIGFFLPQVTTKNGQRYSVGEAYLKPAHVRKNLYVKPLAQVIKIIISPHTKQASGVKYLHEGKLYIAKAHKEVIISAGAIKTPQLLMLSGIGPKEDLEKHDIKVVHDLPVGKHLKDHLGFVGVNFVFNDTKPQEHDEKAELVAYLKDGKGPMTSAGIASGGYIKTKASKDKDSYPDVELYFVPMIFNTGYEKTRRARITKETYDSVWKPLEGHNGFTINVMQTHPKSVGTVTLKDKDPLHHPIVDSNLLSDPDEHDIDTMLAGVREALNLADTESLQKLGIHLNINPIHDCEEHQLGSDKYWKCAIRHMSISLRHLTGTARMGPDTDKHAVVDKYLKVHGIHKLRVADASVIPISITGHTMAPAIMIGEKAADLIKEHWK